MTFAACHSRSAGFLAIVVLLAPTTALAGMIITPPPVYATVHYTLDAGAAHLHGVLQQGATRFPQGHATQPILRLGPDIPVRWTCAAPPPALRRIASLRVWLAPSFRRTDPPGTWRGRVVVQRLDGYAVVQAGSKACWRPRITTAMDTRLVLIMGASQPVTVGRATGAPFGRVRLSLRVSEDTALPGARSLP